MLQFIVLTIGLLIGLSILMYGTKRQEIMANWKDYRTNPIFIFSAFLYKPDNDPRSRFQFTSDNFKEVIGQLVIGLFEVILSPIFKLLRMIAQTIQKQLDGIVSMRNVFGGMWRSFMNMSAIFENRFAMVLHKLRVTMFRLFTAFQRVTGVATSAVFTGLSTIYSMLNFIDLIIKIIIIILVVLVVLVIFFFFILAPFIPVILVVIGIISTTAMAGAVGGMASTFCFGENTPIPMKDGTIKSISQVQVGDFMENGDTVTAHMKFLTPQTGMFELEGIIVSGSHIVFHSEKPMFVSQHPNAKPTKYEGQYVYCLNTTSHKIQIGNLFFSDWEELTSEEDLQKWNQFVFETLNSSQSVYDSTICSNSIHSEAAVISSTLIQTSKGPIPICSVHPGMSVLDANGIVTKVTGFIEIASSEIHAVTQSGISDGVWLRGTDGLWQQPKILHSNLEMHTNAIYVTITTEAGSYLLASGIGIRDFTDVGADQISKSYTWVLDSL